MLCSNSNRFPTARYIRSSILRNSPSKRIHISSGLKISVCVCARVHVRVCLLHFKPVSKSILLNLRGFFALLVRQLWILKTQLNWTSDPENRPVNRNERRHRVISVSVNKWNGGREGKCNAFSVPFNISFSWMTSVLRKKAWKTSLIPKKWDVLFFGEKSDAGRKSMTLQRKEKKQIRLFKGSYGLNSWLREITTCRCLEVQSN